MSIVKIQAPLSGTGTVTIAAPTTNSDRTVTLPDENGTLILTGGALGTPSSGNGSNLTNLNASNLASGTVPDARFPATLPAVSGANLTSLNASNLSSGTVGTARLGTGTANSTTFLRGDQTWATVTSLPGAQGQVFTSNGTFTIPSGISALKVTALGGGGGGGGASSAVCFGGSGGGGGGGGTAVTYLTGLTPGNTLSVTVGAGGTAGGTGGTGGTSSVASGTQSITTISGSGGGGGGNGNQTSGAQGAGGGTSGATYGISGSAALQAGSLVFGGMSQFSTTNVRTAGQTAGPGQSGVGFGLGTGSTGSSSNGGGGVSGGTGSAGIVIIEW